MTITKTTKPDALLFRFDPDADKPIIRGVGYYERTVVTENGAVLSSQESPAQPVSIAKGVPGLDLATVLGTLAEGLTALTEEQADTIAALTADNKAKDDNAQALLERIATLEYDCNRLRIAVEALAPEDPGPGSAAEPGLEP